MHTNSKKCFVLLKCVYIFRELTATYILFTADNFSYHNGMMFTTKDSDNDKWGGNCAARYGNGWRFKTCTQGNLNEVYYRKPKVTSAGMTWYYWENRQGWESLKASKMMIRSWLFQYVFCWLLNKINNAECMFAFLWYYSIIWLEKSWDTRVHA